MNELNGFQYCFSWNSSINIENMYICFPTVFHADERYDFAKPYQSHVQLEEVSLPRFVKAIDMLYSLPNAQQALHLVVHV